MTISLESLDQNSLAIVQKFSKGLAANELKVRNAAFKKVREWLVNKSNKDVKLDKYVVIFI